MQFSFSLSSSNMAVTVVGTSLGVLLAGGWGATEVGVKVGAVGGKVDSMGGAIAGEPGINVGAVGDKVNGCAVRWRLAAGIKVVAVGDSVKSMGVEVVSDADKGVDCVGCA